MLTDLGLNAHLECSSVQTWGALGFVLSLCRAFYLWDNSIFTKETKRSLSLQKKKKKNKYTSSCLILNGQCTLTSTNLSVCVSSFWQISIPTDLDKHWEQLLLGLFFLHKVARVKSLCTKNRTPFWRDVDRNQICISRHHKWSRYIFL